jgi:pyridoxamine 5'-phosphate oxidase
MRLLTLLKPWPWRFSYIREIDLAQNPITQFAVWYKRAKRCLWIEFPEAMCLSTISNRECVTARFVLLKSFDESGFVFYTNTNSPKAEAILLNPNVALTFYWEALQRQVRIEGQAALVSEAEADNYFNTRPRLSQIGAWASKQSSVIDNRSELDNAVIEVSKRFKNSKVPRPQHWGGFRVAPIKIEFWQLRPNRLHDRFLYTRQEDNTWRIQRLSP